MARTAAAGAAKRIGALSEDGLRGESEGRYGSRRDSTCGAPGRSPRRDLSRLFLSLDNWHVWRV